MSTVAAIIFSGDCERRLSARLSLMAGAAVSPRKRRATGLRPRGDGRVDRDPAPGDRVRALRGVAAILTGIPVGTRGKCGALQRVKRLLTVRLVGVAYVCPVPHRRVTKEKKRWEKVASSFKKKRWLVNVE